VARKVKIKLFKFQHDFGNFDVLNLSGKLIVLLTLGAWLPAHNHCLLVSVFPVSEPGGCCGETEDHRHQHDPLENCGMCSIESGDVLTFTNENFIFESESDLTLGGIFDFDICAAREIFVPAPIRAPPDFKVWHFKNRSAVPGRSPSFLL